MREKRTDCLDIKQQIALSGGPPLPDEAFRIPQEFNSRSFGTTKWLSQCDYQETWYASSPPAGSTRSGSNAANTKRDLRRTRYLPVDHDTQAGLSPTGVKDAAEESRRRTHGFVSAQSQSAVHPSSSTMDPTEDISSVFKKEGQFADNPRQARTHHSTSVANTSLGPLFEIGHSGIPAKNYRNMAVGLSAGSGAVAKASLRSCYRKQTPSERLLAALPWRTRIFFTSPSRRKADLSHVAVRHWDNTSKIQKTGRSSSVLIRDLGLPSNGEKHGTRTLSDILSRYLVTRSICEQKAISQLHDVETARALRSAGYSVDDVLRWSRILTSSDLDRAVLEAAVISKGCTSFHRPDLPTFLLMFILRARYLGANTLKHLLNYIWAQYVGDTTPAATARMNDEHTSLILIVRLLRHARVVWPNALEDIASLATRLLGDESKQVASLGRQRTQRLSHVYNRLLALFAEPTSLRTFQSIAIQQRAQLHLVRKMTTFRPHLPLTREGFQALIRVQLAHRKTEPERKWARSKSLAWPPWKEDLLGIDADSDNPGKTSRAADVLSRMTEAGYTHLHWEQTARILAGWDTDDSPTIQTRTFVKRAPILRSVDIKLAVERSSAKQHEIWAARIWATRTVKEAWACFTSYDKSTTGEYALGPYHAMLERLLNSQKNRFDQDDGYASIVPGDGKETWAEPKSSHYFLYVPSHPPSVSDFFDKMTERGLKPPSYMLVGLLDRAETLAEGMKYVNAGELLQHQKNVLLGNTEASGKRIRKVMDNVTNRVIAAFIRFLCRVEATPGISFALPKTSGSHEATLGQRRTTDPFLYARNFVSALRPSYRPIWYALLEGFYRQISGSQPLEVCRLWGGFLNQLHDMDAYGINIDSDGFRSIGDILEEVILCDPLILPNRELGLFPKADCRLSCGWLCKSLFNAMSYGGSVQSKHDVARTTCWLPLNHSNLIDIPNPAVLHRTIRILGMGQDSASILTLLRWMHCFAAELGPVADELANGQKLTHRAIVAARYFLEKYWQYDSLDQWAAMRIDWRAEQRDMVLEAKAIIDQHANDWGGWATDVELYQYHHVNKVKARRLRASL